MSEGETKLPDWGAAGSDSSPESKKVLRAGRSHGRDAVLGIGTLVTITVVCGVLAAWALRDTSGDKKQDSDTISKQYKDLMEDPRVKEALRQLNLGDDEAGRKNRDAMLYNNNITKAYLDGGDKENWENLIGNLEKGNGPAFFGQTAALANAKCLTDEYHINVVSCDRNPGFKNLDSKTKSNYIEKYNAAVDRAKKAHPSFFSIPPPKMSGVDIRQIHRRQDQRKLQVNEIVRRGKEQRSIRRPFA